MNIMGYTLGIMGIMAIIFGIIQDSPIVHSDIVHLGVISLLASLYWFQEEDIDKLRKEIKKK